MLQAELNEQFAVTHEVSTVMATMVRPPLHLRYHSHFHHLTLTLAVTRALTSALAVPLAVLTSSQLATEDVQELLLAALKGLNDVENSSASADCVMLNSTPHPFCLS